MTVRKTYFFVEQNLKKWRSIVSLFFGIATLTLLINMLLYDRVFVVLGVFPLWLLMDAVRSYRVYRLIKSASSLIPNSSVSQLACRLIVFHFRNRFGRRVFEYKIEILSPFHSMSLKPVAESSYFATRYGVEKLGKVLTPVEARKFFFRPFARASSCRMIEVSMKGYFRSGATLPFLIEDDKEVRVWLNDNRS